MVFSPGEVGALRILFAAIVLTPIALKNVSKIDRKNWHFLLAVGFAGSFLPAFLFAAAQTRLESSIAGVLNALTPLFVLITGVLFFGQGIHKRTTIGLLVGFAGTAVLVMAGEDGGFAGFNAYALLVVLATICYGFNINIVKYKLVGMGSIALTSIALVMVGPLAAAYLLTATPVVAKIQATEGALLALAALATLGIMGTAVALVLYNKLAQITNPIFASSVTYLIPIIAVMWGILDGEVLVLQHYLGMAVILVGVFIANKRV